MRLVAVRKRLKYNNVWEVNIMEERYELKEEEVNVYTGECGKIQEFCLQDCIDGSAWVSIES